MSFGVFIHRSDSIYDDSPAERYQFPAQYLKRAEACIGDWIVYLEPRRVAQSRGYFAVARVQEVIRDPGAPDMYLAIIEPRTYLDFAKPVPFNDNSGPVERGLLNDSGRLTGRVQSAVRPISAADFNRIIELGFGDDNLPLPRLERDTSGFEETQTPFDLGAPHSRLRQLTSRLVRDRVFRRVVLRAYDERCALTGLKLINGAGRAEVAAAHIQPVEENGPDHVCNGIALSGTAHWMFDRGLISLSDSLQILVSRQVNDLDSVQGFINRNGFAHSPSRISDRPHPHFLQWHRQNRFKQ